VGVGRFDEPMEGVEVPEFRMDVGEVRDVISAIPKGRRIDRGHPDGIDPEPTQVAEPFGETTEITNSIAIGIAVAAGDELIDDRAIPPGMLSRGWGPGLSPAGPLWHQNER